MRKRFQFIGPSPSMDFPIWKAGEALTITGITVTIPNGTSVTGGLAGIMTDAEFGVGITAHAAFTNASVAQGSWVTWHTTAVDGTPAMIAVTIEYEVVA
jgi:hypothetical protein